ncbi:MAG: hypothetical protein ACO2XQ_00300 [Flavobacteriales bacterium]
MPHPLHAFFKQHRPWLNDHALDADIRKHSIKDEKYRHYIDLDSYHEELDSLQSIFPLSWSMAIEQWGMDSIQHHGVGPWHAHLEYLRLINAYRTADTARILRHAIDLAHYVSDLHVPLHTTKNYNGQDTNQEGIHALWETQVPEAFQEIFNLHPRSHGLEAEWIESVDGFIWMRTLDSHSLAPLVFSHEIDVRREFESKAIDAYIIRGRIRQLMRSDEFVQAYYLKIGPQVESQMIKSIHAVSSLWFSAWVEAGQPELGPYNADHRSRFKKMLDWWLK